MRRISQLVRFTVAVGMTMSMALSAEAQRCCRPCRPARCPGASLCCPPIVPDCRPRGDNYICYLVKVYTIEPGAYVFAAEYHEGECRPDFDSVYAIGPYEYDPHQDCYKLECVESRKVRRQTFKGFPDPLRPDFVPDFDPDYIVEDYYERLHHRGEGRTYKVRVFDLQLPSGKQVYVAFEVSHFPPGDPQPPMTVLERGMVKPWAGKHAYSIRNYHGRGMLLLVDREG